MFFQETPPPEELESETCRQATSLSHNCSLPSESPTPPAVPRLDDTLNTLRIAVEQLLTSNKPAEVDPRRHFYKVFNQEADEYDRDFHKKYHDDLNTTLIFVS